jgi:hypothetical protein
MASNEEIMSQNAIDMLIAQMANGGDSQPSESGDDCGSGTPEPQETSPGGGHGG